MSSFAANAVSRPLIVIILDGLRWDYFHQYSKLPTFQKIAREGVRVERVIPIFPPVSGPCWTTLYTGLYPESHGMLDHLIYDKTLGEKIYFLGGERKECSLLEGEPIWITALKNNLKVKVIRWSMCEIKYNNISTEDMYSFFRETEPPTRETMLRNLYDAVDSIQQGYDLIMIHDDYIDHVAHKWSVNGEEMAVALKDTDVILEKFVEYLKKYNLYKIINVIILSDHGNRHFGVGSEMKPISLSQYLTPKSVLCKEVQPGYTTIYTRTPTVAEELYNKLKNIYGLYVYRRRDIPENLHYRNNRRTPDLLLISKPDYIIYYQTPKYLRNSATHAWATDVPDMWGMFLGVGPDFQSNYVHFSLDLVDIYQIFAKILVIKPQPHNGTWSNVDRMIRK